MQFFRRLRTDFFNMPFHLRYFFKVKIAENLCNIKAPHIPEIGCYNINFFYRARKRKQIQY